MIDVVHFNVPVSINIDFFNSCSSNINNPLLTNLFNYQRFLVPTDIRTELHQVLSTSLYYNYITEKTRFSSFSFAINRR